MMWAGTPISWMMSVTTASRLGSAGRTGAGRGAAGLISGAATIRRFSRMDAASQGLGMK